MLPVVTYLIGLMPYVVGLLLQLPVAVATAAAIRAAATGCLGFLSHDVCCNVLHFLSLLVQGKLL